jgi:hypothetical protein
MMPVLGMKRSIVAPGHREATLTCIPLLPVGQQ